MMKEFAEGIKFLFEGVGALVSSLIPLLWTGAIVFLVYYHREALKSLVASLAGREFTLEIAGQKLSFKDYNDQQSKRIEELEARVMQLEGQRVPQPEALEAEEVPTATMGKDVRAPSPPPLAACSGNILWVDDNPKNNAVLVDSLQKLGLQVELALTTNDGLRRFAQGNIGMVISDMGRTEDGRYHPKAGMELAAQIRAMDSDVPIAVYTTRQGVRTSATESAQLNFMATSSSFALTRFVREAYHV